MMQWCNSGEHCFLDGLRVMSLAHFIAWQAQVRERVDKTVVGQQGAPASRACMEGLKTRHYCQLTSCLCGVAVPSPCRQDFEAVQDILQQLLQPRLLACVSSLLSSSTSPAAFQDKLDILLQHTPLTPAQQDSGCHSQQELQQQQQAVKAQVYLVLDILQRALPTWPQELIAAGCKQLLCWTLSTTGQDLFTSVLGATAAAPAGAGGDQVAQPLADGQGPSSGLELIQAVLQGCLVGFAVCWGLLQDMQQQQLELLAAVNMLGV